MSEPARPDEDRVHGVQRALAVIAALDAAFLMATAIHHAGWHTYLTEMALGIALPVLATPFFRRPYAFFGACTAVASWVAVCSLGLSTLGVFALWPTAALLVAAALADPRRRPDGVWLICFFGVLPRLATVWAVVH
ncbi:hypothetical protein ACIQWR_28350 [Streptomyces sp. NPDC098789]|uniref:hypothetical protein n=1 Tax=Streptomyces sp. NPDC098789 TaxID=3366098 RepID=UPI00382EDAE9